MANRSDLKSLGVDVRLSAAEKAISGPFDGKFSSISPVHGRNTPRTNTSSASVDESKTFASTTGSLLEGTQYVLDIIHADSLTPKRSDILVKDTLKAWTDHVNPAFLTYRKSVADDFAAVEWRAGPPGGAILIDAHGKEYIDCLGGYGIFNVGHSNPVVLDAVHSQMRKQSLHSQELLDPLRAYCAELLHRTLPGSLQYSFFTNSGAESVEAALKFAILATSRKHFIGVVGAFHGKTIGALSATSKSVFRKPFTGSLLDFTHVPVNDISALAKAFEVAKFTGNEIAGFIVEPILGEGGIHVCNSEYLQAARRLCDEYGACLIFDEVQSGMGRSGRWWACDYSGVAPDIMAIGKAFGGGVMPAGATVGTAKVWQKYLENPFLFTTTFGGNPISMAAAIATMHVIEKDGLLNNTVEKGDALKAGMQKLADKFPHIVKEVRGRGLMLGFEFHSDEIGYNFSRGCFNRGVLLAGTLVNSRTIRVEPPLTITDKDVASILQRFEGAMQWMTENMPIFAHLRRSFVKEDLSDADTEGSDASSVGEHDHRVTLPSLFGAALGKPKM